MFFFDVFLKHKQKHILYSFHFLILTLDTANKILIKKLYICIKNSQSTYIQYLLKLKGR